MFALSYTSRCLICRAAFIACCVVPTLGVLLYAGWLKLPGHVAGFEQRLEQELRMSAKLAAAEPLQPGRTMLHGIELTDRLSGRWIARVPRLETGRNGSTLVLIASQVDLSGDCWKHLVNLLDDHAGRSLEAVTLSASRLNWHRGDEVVQLEQFTARLEQSENGPVCDVHFRLNGRRAAEPVHFMMARVRDGQRQLTGYQVDTGDLPVPCSLALPALAWLDQLGPRAQFSGQATVYHGDDGWQGEMRGKMSEIDLRRLSQPLGHEIHGLAELRIERARFDQSRLTDVSGSLSAGPGLIGHSLRMAAIGGLRLQPANPLVDQSPDLLPYDELAFQFTVRAGGLTIAGCCGQGPQGSVLCDRREPLLTTAPQGQQLPLASLIQTLAPAGDRQVPATRQTGWLLEMLPTP
jgi:hypothetical protein